MTNLIVTPLQEELDLLAHTFHTHGFVAQDYAVGRITTRYIPQLDVLLAAGGLGKAQFGIQTQHLLDLHGAVDAVVCAGAAGALAERLQVGDVVIATTTVEHDCKYGFTKRPPPRFEGSHLLLTQLQNMQPFSQSFTVHYDVIASGDEDIIDRARAEEVRVLTGAVAVAWEGAGGARACAFNALPFVEIRGVTDTANHDAPHDFATNLARAMTNIAILVMQWLGRI